MPDVEPVTIAAGELILPDVVPAVRLVPVAVGLGWAVVTITFPPGAAFPLAVRVLIVKLPLADR